MRGSDGTERVPEGKVVVCGGKAAKFFRSRRHRTDATASVTTKAAILGVVFGCEGILEKEKKKKAERERETTASVRDCPTLFLFPFPPTGFPQGYIFHGYG